jgi:SOS-response transcriptional repressor LexA
MEDTLTPRQFEVLNAIAQYVQDHGYGPTVRVLGDLLEIASTSNVNYYLRKFGDEGLITYATLGSRRQMIGYTMRLTESGRQVLGRHLAQSRTEGWHAYSTR